jgi:pyruvate/2-oxoglutarate/acetoin dehydrogenase E1 component
MVVLEGPTVLLLKLLIVQERAFDFLDAPIQRITLTHQHISSIVERMVAKC